MENVGRDGLGVWYWHVRTAIQGIDWLRGLQYRMGKSIQYYVMAYMEKESEKQ